MDTQNTSVHPHSKSRTSGKNHPRCPVQPSTHTVGVVHDNTKHSSRFTVIGNHLAQHAELSGLAIGLAVHIQSLQAGTPVDIKTLSARFPESTARIAAALRELEAHGYLRRPRERISDGRIVTRTISCNQPGRSNRAKETAEAPKPPARRAATAATPSPPRRTALPAVPQPTYPAPELLSTATDVLAGLRRREPRLFLSATDVEHLAPGVAAWLERDLTPTAVTRALSEDLPPEDLRRPAAFLSHRLTQKLPPIPPFRASTPRPVTHPLQNCPSCDRAFRSPTPGTCHPCTTQLAAPTHPVAPVTDSGADERCPGSAGSSTAREARPPRSPGR
ncbi:helix-turn-helix domain-containing protein [Streptomyces sp. NPDC087425]|uniref:helix-turn-helix domain-containing protein n=1 Tax=unclassified Streptomyces TaxID=2593676 RepID=UPI0038255D7F